MGAVRGDDEVAITVVQRLERPRLRQHPRATSTADVVLPQLADMPIAIEVTTKISDLGGIQRDDWTETGGIVHRLRVFDEMDAVDQNARHRLGDDNLTMRADEQSVVGVEAARQRAAPLGRAYVNGFA